LKIVRTIPSPGKSTGNCATSSRCSLPPRRTRRCGEATSTRCCPTHTASRAGTSWSCPPRTTSTATGRRWSSMRWRHARQAGSSC